MAGDEPAGVWCSRDGVVMGWVCRGIFVVRKRRRSMGTMSAEDMPFIHSMYAYSCFKQETAVRASQIIEREWIKNELGLMDSRAPSSRDTTGS